MSSILFFNWLRIVRLLSVFVLIILIPADPVQAAPKKLLKVGVILPLTGPLSIQGVPMKNAMQMAKADFDRDNILELLFEDDGFLPRNTITAAKKLVMQDKVQSLIVFGTNQSLAIVDFVEQQKIPFISVNVNRSVVEGRKYSVMLMPDLQILTQKNIEEALRRNYRKVAIIATQQDSCLLQRKTFEDSGKFEVTYSDEVAPSEVSFYEHTSRIIAGKPDAVFLSVLPPQGSLIARALREKGYKGELFGGQQIANLSELNASNGALEGAWVVGGDDRDATDYYRHAKKQFKEIPTTESIYTYDSINLILAAHKSGDVNHFLHTVKDFQGFGGRYSADGNNGFGLKAVAKEFSGKGFRYLN